MTSTITTASQFRQWVVGASACFDDPTETVCLLCFRWVDRPEAHRGEDLVCGNLVHGAMDLWLGHEPLPVPIAAGDHELGADGCVARFGAQRIAPGVWAICPSLNLPGIIHGFALLHGVPEPAPFEQAASPRPKIWTPGEIVVPGGAS